jgi:hypothetical protein
MEEWIKERIEVMQAEIENGSGSDLDIQYALGQRDAFQDVLDALRSQK